MKMTAQLQLKPTRHQAELLKATLERANAACDAISDYAWTHNVFGKYALQEALYASLRIKFAMTAQLVIRCLCKVSDAYKLDKDTKRQFKQHGAIAYDSRILKYRTDKQVVSIWTLPGRETMPYVCGERQRELLKHQKGESDLVYHRGKWYLLATCEIDEPTPDEMDGWLGVDRGVVNVATDSQGNIYTGARVEQRHALQKKNTKSAKRKIKKVGNKQARFQKDVNHCIAKELVIRAKRTKQGIALEDLTGITLRTRVSARPEPNGAIGASISLGSLSSTKPRCTACRIEKLIPAIRASAALRVDILKKRIESRNLSSFAVLVGTAPMLT